MSEMQRLVVRIKDLFESNRIKVQNDSYKPIKYLWKCPENFLWVEVKLLGSFIENREGESKRIFI